MNYSPLILQLRVAFANYVTANKRLEVGNDFRQLLITHFFKLTEDTSLEEDLGVTYTVVVADVKGSENLLRCNLAINEAGWDGTGSEY